MSNNEAPERLGDIDVTSNGKGDQAMKTSSIKRGLADLFNYCYTKNATVGIWAKLAVDRIERLEDELSDALDDPEKYRRIMESMK